MPGKRGRKVEVPAGYALVQHEGAWRVSRDGDSALASMNWTRGEPTLREWMHEQAAAAWVKLLVAGAPVVMMRLAWIAPAAEEMAATCGA